MVKESNGMSQLPKMNYLAKAYGFRVPQDFECSECGAKFTVVQRNTEIDEFDYHSKTCIKSEWYNVKLRTVRRSRKSKDSICLLFYFDCPECGKRYFTECYKAQMYDTLQRTKYFDNLIAFERDIINHIDSRYRRSRSVLDDKIAVLEKATTGAYVKDKDTGLYSMIGYVHGKD